MLSTHQARVFACACMRFGIHVNINVNEDREIWQTRQRRMAYFHRRRNDVYAPGARTRFGIIVKINVNKNREMRQTHQWQMPDCPGGEMLSTHQARAFAFACMRFGILVNVNKNRETRQAHRWRMPECPRRRNAIYAPAARIRLRVYAFRNNC